MDEITTMLSMIEDVAPEVWRIAMRQVAIEVHVLTFWAIFLTIFGLICAGFSIAQCRKSSCHDKDAAFGLGLFAVLFLTIDAIVVSSLYTVIANPEYYAIKLLRGG